MFLKARLLLAGWISTKAKAMGVFTRQYEEKVDSIVTECYVYAPSDLSGGDEVKRVKIQRSLWDTGASVSLISARVAKVLGLESIGKSGVSGYNEGIDVKDKYDVVIGMDVICNGDLAITNKDDKTTFSFRIPSEAEIDFSK